MRLLAIVLAVITAGCAAEPEGPIYGEWTPVSVNDCTDIGVLISESGIGTQIGDRSIIIGQTAGLDLSEPGYAVLAYHPVTWVEGQRVSHPNLTSYLRFRLIDEDHIRAVGMRNDDEESYQLVTGPFQRVLGDLKRC